MRGSSSQCSAVMKGAELLRKILAASCLLAVGGGGLCLAQRTSQDARPAEARVAPRPAGAELDELAARAKELDEPALRVPLRTQLAAFLWSGKSADDARRAEALATQALEDLHTNKARVPRFYFTIFRKDLFALLEQHSPATAKALSERYDSGEEGGDDIATALEMLNGGQGAERAVEKARRGLNGDAVSVPALVFFLSRLDQTRPAEANRLLVDILNAAESRPGSLSVGDLGRLKHFYFYRAGAPPELKARFLSAALAATRESASWPEQERVAEAYHLLAGTLPEIQRLLPSAYLQASAQVGMISARMPRQAVEQMAAAERVSESPDRLSQLATEAASADSPSAKASLQTDAAHAALRRGKFVEAVDLAVGVKSEGEIHGLWRDQFLRDVVVAALNKKDAEAAEYAAEKIGAPAEHSGALQRLALHYHAAGDVARAWGFMNGALKIIDTLEDEGRAVALFKITTVFMKVDRQRAPEIAREAVKSLEKVAGPRPEDKPGGGAHLAAVERVLRVAYALTPVFRVLAQFDAAEAASVAASIGRREFRPFASLGVLTAPGRK